MASYDGAALDSEKYAGRVTDDTNAPPSLYHIDPVVEKRVLRKLDTRLVTLVSAFYLLAFLDRGNIGNAKIAGMSRDLHLSSADYTWLLTIFYISYICFEFLVLMWKIVPPHIWAAFLLFSWGTLATCQAGVSSWAGEMVVRFLLGAFEAAYGPGIPYLLSFFYLRHELGLRCGMFLSAAPLASTFAGALAYGITSGHSKLANWKLLFLVEGLPTVLMAAVAFFFLPDSPAQARFLNAEEKKVAIARGVRQVGSEDRRGGGIQFREIFKTFVDPKAWLTAFMYFSCNVSFASLPVFLPTILTELGFTAVHAQGLSAPPYFASFLITILSTYIADRTQQRGFMVMCLALVGGIGYIILATTVSVGARYFAIFLVAAGVFPAIANILPWVLNNQGNDTRRGAGIMILNLIGQCGPLVGTNVYPAKEGPRYVKGHSICAGFLFFTVLLAVTLRTLLVWENKKLARDEVLNRDVIGVEAEGDAKGVASVGVENYGAGFRYVL